MAEPVDVDVDTIIERLLEGENIILNTQFNLTMRVACLPITWGSVFHHPPQNVKLRQNFTQPVALLLML